MLASLTAHDSQVSVIQMKLGLTAALKMRRVCILLISDRMLTSTIERSDLPDIVLLQKLMSCLRSSLKVVGAGARPWSGVPLMVRGEVDPVSKVLVVGETFNTSPSKESDAELGSAIWEVADF